MSSLIRLVTASFCLQLLLFVSASLAQDGGAVVRQENKRILAELQKTVDWSFLESPLEDVLDSVAAGLSANLYLDQPALEDFGIGTDTPVTFVMKGLPTRSALSLMLEQVDLTWDVRDGLLWITTGEQAESKVSVRAYSVADLVLPRRENPEAFEMLGVDVNGRLHQYADLIEVITSTIERDSWDNVGGPGSINGVLRTLVVAQTREVHDQVARLLAGFRKLRTQLLADPEVIPGAISLNDSYSPRIRRALVKTVTIDFRETPLERVAAQISELHSIPVLLDVPALEDYGVGTDTPLSGNLRGLPLGRSLQIVLEQFGLTFVVRNDVVLITTREEAEDLLEIRLYPVGDLANSRESIRKSAGELSELTNMIQAAVQPDSWARTGGPGSIALLRRPAVLVVAQTEAVHSQLSDLLNELHRIVRTRQGGE